MCVCVSANVRGWICKGRAKVNGGIQETKNERKKTINDKDKPQTVFLYLVNGGNLAIEQQSALWMSLSCQTCRLLDLTGFQGQSGEVRDSAMVKKGSSHADKEHTTKGNLAGARNILVRARAQQRKARREMVNFRRNKPSRLDGVCCKDDRGCLLRSKKLQRPIQLCLLDENVTSD